MLELLSRFLAPLRLPHKFYLVTMECERENASPFYSGELMKKVQARNWLAPPGAK